MKSGQVWRGVFAAVLVMFHAAALADHSEQMLTFDELVVPPQRQTTPVTNGYGGLYWSRFEVMDAMTQSETSAARRALVSGRNILRTSETSSYMQSGFPFTLRSAWMTGPEGNSQALVTIIGWLGASRVSTNTVMIGSAPTKAQFDIENVTMVQFVTSGFRISIDDMQVSPPIERLLPGTGLFKQDRLLFGAGPAMSVLSADFNGDSFSDLVTTSTNGTRIDLGRADGTLELQPIAPLTARFANVGYYDGDERPDIMSPILNQYLTYTNATGYKHTALFTSDAYDTIVIGDFGGGARYRTQSTAIDMAAADFNNDGRLDYALVRIEEPRLQVHINNGFGSFTLTNTLPFLRDPLSVTPHDLDGDGDQDLLTANETTGTIGIALNDGAGNFSAWTLHPAGLAKPMSAAVADIDGDITEDIVVRSATSGLSVLLGRGNQTYSQPILLTHGGSVPIASRASRPLVVTDLNRDGAPDIAYISGTEVVILTNIAPPRLRITRNGDLLQLSWQRSFGRGATLQSKSTLDPNADWAPVDFDPITTDDEILTFDAARAPASFFRLLRE